MNGVRAGLALAVLLLASVVSAQPLVPVQDVSSIAGKWKGPGDPGAPGNNPAVIVEQTANLDGTFATSASAEDAAPETAEAIRERARAAAVRAWEKAMRAKPWPPNVRWLLWSEETVMVAETPRLRVLWTLLQAEYKAEACEEARSGRLADAKTLGYTVNDRGYVFPYPTRMVRYLCFPDTEDPRGPRGR